MTPALAAGLTALALFCSAASLALGAEAPDSDSSRQRVRETRGPGYVSYFSGNSNVDDRDTKAGILLAGGAEDQDDAMGWFVARSGRGDIVVLRASGAAGYNDYFLGLGANSVESIVISSRAAADSREINAKLEKAEGVFFAGGDQANYIKLFQATRLVSTLNKKAATIPIGGTSAGLAVLGEFIYSALKDTVDSYEALENPFHDRVTLANDFLVLAPLANTITDSHFAARDRMGRLVAFLARLNATVGGFTSQARGIGIDEDTAVIVDELGKGRLLGRGKAYFLTTRTPAESCTREERLTYERVEAYRLSKGETFDFRSFKGENHAAHYVLTVREGRMSSDQADPNDLY